MPWLLQHVLAAIVLTGTCWRLATLAESGCAPLSRLRWHGWMLGHVLVGAGACASLLGLLVISHQLILLGMALCLVTRPDRRRSDR